MRGTLIIFVKAPVAGRVKTRLAAETGAARAAMIFRILTANTIAAVSKGPWRTMIAVDPPAAAGRFGALWPRRFDRLIQSRGDLGRRMGDAFARTPRGPKIIIGADAPDIRAAHIRAAFRALAGHDAVFGPAADGGYWLIGLAGRRPAAGLFDGVRWSSAYTLADTVKNLAASRIFMLATLQDIDNGADLKTHGARAFSRTNIRR
ncbi:MAG: TIGR04282 family arsenosugar biosynthesis glycosyltransferase [Parvularculaceae bacterium]|nr:TIGR04282 family arsenosugar biosynthesis glycosyltransferase [Parvularculaceae bacterium]